MKINEFVDFSNSDAMALYQEWDSPVAIICDGPYGINGFPGDLLSDLELGAWYEPHIAKWSKKATPMTTLWFWNTEQGWANVHPILLKYGWEFKACNIWNKGMSHVAGNTNTKTLSHLPVVTEVCVQYVKKPVFYCDNTEMSAKEWLRYEWTRTGLPFSKTNEACGVKDAATRKYFTKCHLWYLPPAEAFEKIAIYANQYGREDGKPYFSVDGITPLTKADWAKMRAKFYCPIGVTNVWTETQLRGNERLKRNQKAIHLNQKPLAFIEQCITMSTDEGDCVWDPFAGLCTTGVAATKLKRRCFCSEISPEVYEVAKQRLLDLSNQGEQLSF